MALVGILWPLFGLISLVGFVWLTVVAFKRHVGWGLAVFFLSPFAAIFFGIKYWRESRTPFLVYMASLVLSVGLALYTFSAFGGFEMIAMANQVQTGEITEEEAMVQMMQQLEQSGSLTEEQEGELRRMREMVQEAREQEGVDPSVPAEQPSESNTRTVERKLRVAQGGVAPVETTTPPDAADLIPLGYKRVALRDASDYLGHSIRIVGKDGVEHRGKLANADSDALMVERRLLSGTISFELLASEIDSLLVAYR